jgi:acetyl esterase
VQYPVVDPQDASDHGAAYGGADPQEFTAQYLGGTPRQHPDRLRAVSSATYLSPKAPPTLIIEPERDTFVPSAGVFAFARQARAAGVPLKLARIPFATHSYDSIAAGSIGNQAHLSIEQNFLDELGLSAEHSG